MAYLLMSERKNFAKTIKENLCSDINEHDIVNILTTIQSLKYYIIPREEYEKLTKELITEQRAKEIAQEYFGIVCKETAEKIIDLIKAFCPDKKFIEVITRIISERLGLEIKE